MKINEKLIPKLGELNQKMNWKLLGSADGTNKITLPTDYNEILVLIHDKEHDMNFSILIPKLFINAFNTQQSYQSGYSQANSFIGRANIRVFEGKVWLYQLWVNAEEYTSKATIYCYYR